MTSLILDDDRSPMAALSAGEPAGPCGGVAGPTGTAGKRVSVSVNGAPAGAPAGATGYPAPAQILVIDDDAAIRGIVERALDPEGYAVAAAADGTAALDLLRAGVVAPSLILLDWGIDSTGTAFAAAYRALPLSCPPAAIVVFTAASASAAAEAADEIGASGFLCKPFDIDDLLDLAGRFVGPPPQPGSDAGISAAATPLVAPSPVPRTSTTTSLAPEALDPPDAFASVAIAVADRRGARPSVRQPSHKDLAAKARREAALRRLAGEVQRIRVTLEGRRASLQQLLETEQQRRLTAEEAGSVRHLRWESERLRWELVLLREEFERLRASKASGSP